MNINIKKTQDYQVKCYKGVKIKLKHLTTGESADVMDYVPAVLDIDGNTETPARMAYDTAKLFKYMVMEVENLTLTADKKIIEIKNGSDIILNPGLNDLYIELVPVLLKMDARVDAKN